MNSITLIGTVDAEVVYHCDGQARDLARFYVLTDRPTTAGGPEPSPRELPSEQQRHECVAWGPAALDLSRHLRRGSRVQVRGELLYRERGGRGGVHWTACEIRVRGYTYLGIDPLPNG